MKVDLVTSQEFSTFKHEVLLMLKKMSMTSRSVEPLWKKGKEVKQELKISDSTLQRMRISNEITYRKIGKTYFYQIPKPE